MMSSRREFINQLVVITLISLSGCLSNNNKNSRLNNTSNNINETNNEGTQSSLGRGETEVLDEEFYVNSPYGEGSSDSIRILNDKDRTVRCTVELFEDDEMIYALRIRLGPYGTYTDGMEIAREGVYEVHVESDNRTTSGSWRVGEGYTGLVVDADKPEISQIKRRGTVEVRTLGRSPEGSEPVSSEEISEYEPIHTAIKQHHRCETDNSEEDCETAYAVTGEDWVTATRAYNVLSDTTNNEGSGVYVRYNRETYVFSVETEV
jgi:hypothetical protein